MIKDLEILRKWHKLAAHSRSIEEFERLTSESEFLCEAVSSGERAGEKEQGGHEL